MKIKLNQLGYRPGDKKIAVLSPGDSEFEVFRQTAAGSQSVLCGKVSAPVGHAASKGSVCLADFTGITERGEYFLKTPSGESYGFIIDENPYGNLRRAILEMFNYQKCGVSVNGGLWSHSACHTGLAAIYETEIKKDVSGGWHDAGDYGRYVVPAAKTVADLLLAYELSKNPDSEVLDTVWFEIEWMLKMQDEATGAVYHKVSCKSFCALDMMPEDENGELFIAPPSLNAAGDFAAVMAMASRFYPEKKEMLLSAAKSAFLWCESNLNMTPYKNPAGIRTGGYTDPQFQDEIFWAAAELFIATGDEKYHTCIKESEIFTGLGWRDMGTYAIAEYLLHAESIADEKIYGQMKDTLKLLCGDIMQKYGKSPYGDSLEETYIWGSNMVLANNAMTLLLANEIERNPEYTEAAQEHMNYLLGKNAISQSFVTGFGKKSVKNPHHRPSVAKGEAVPGMVAGGPEMHLHDSALKELCAGFPPAKCYADVKESCASNEIAIYWNSPVYFVLALLDL